LEKAIKDFLKNVANTVLKLDILSYYHEHPYAMDTAEGLARWLNRRVEEVTRNLQELVDSGIVLIEGEGTAAVYSYSPEAGISEVVNKVIGSYRLTRDTVYSEVIQLEKKQEELRREYQTLLFNERGKTETILNSMEELVVVLNREGKVLLANERFLRHCPRAGVESTAGLMLEEFIGDESVVRAIRASLSEMGKDEESRELFLNGCYYQLHSVPVTGPDGKVIADKEGKPAATVTVFRDITREKEIERMREDFISMLTHDLKNPLGIILGSSTLVLDGKLGFLNEKQNRLLSNVVKSCGTMDRLINDFLTLSKLEAGMLSLCLEEVVIDNILRSVIELFNPQVRERNLTVSYRNDCEKVPVMADQVQLERVLANIFINAVNYNRDGGRIDLSLRDNGSTVIVEVADTGIGIPQDELPFIFEKFRRASSAKHMKGTGLGLTIVRELVSAMGGEIWVKSTEGRGSSFSFQLPKAAT